MEKSQNFEKKRFGDQYLVFGITDEMDNDMQSLQVWREKNVHCTTTTTFFYSFMAKSYFKSYLEKKTLGGGGLIIKDLLKF